MREAGQCDHFTVSVALSDTDGAVYYVVNFNREWREFY
jgi:hypothetical protein